MDKEDHQRLEKENAELTEACKRAAERSADVTEASILASSAWSDLVESWTRAVWEAIQPNPERIDANSRGDAPARERFPDRFPSIAAAVRRTLEKENAALAETCKRLEKENAELMQSLRKQKRGERHVKAYIASSYADRARSIALMRTLEARGIEITSTWLRIVENDGTHEERQRCADLDLAGVARADIVIAHTLDASATPRGTLVEIGYGLALGKPIFWVGDPRERGGECIFFDATGVTRLHSIEALLVALEDAAERASQGASLSTRRGALYRRNFCFK